MSDPDAAELRRADEERLEFLEAVGVAMARRSEVLQACYEAESPESGVAVVAVMLALPEHLARAVTDMQFRRLTMSARAALEVEQRAIRERLG
ncbi:MAG TPA: hypothetical protein VIP98_06510 [Microlunatus sp.]